ncbi:hypothetical protein Hdeb2414_s0018g00524301 [Helianthus debilis subsp. tardiflorus]
MNMLPGLRRSVMFFFVYDGMSISAHLTCRGHYSRLDSSRRPFRVDAFDQCCYACKMRTSH